MEIMKKSGSEEKMYPVHCTECGERIENKFFPLDDLLDQYHNGIEKNADKNLIIRTLGIGALFGHTVLPKVPPLIENDTVVSQDPQQFLAEETIPRFSSDDDKITLNMLAPVSLNISSIVAQFCLMSGFTDFYEMLRIEKEILDKLDKAETVPPEQKTKLKAYCDKFAALPGVYLPAMSTEENKRQRIEQVLECILRYAKEENQSWEQNSHHFATEELYIGWRYKTVNGRNMPFSLVVRSKSMKVFDCVKCCCDKCHRQIPFDFGAYQQKIIGILGTQATGKTTYLTALADAIGRGEITAAGVKQPGLTVVKHLTDDGNWTRFTSEKMEGALWFYQHGFPPTKTGVNEGEAPALTFLVNSRLAKETIMYTLADIPGEAFSNDVEKEIGDAVADRLKKLLKSSDALIMVVNSGQLLSKTAEEGSSNLIRDPNTVLACYKGFLPKSAIPTAVVLTAADRINGGDLRLPMGLAYDLRKCPVLIGNEKTLLYNAEVMHTTVQAVGAYLDKHFASFMQLLKKSSTDQKQQVLLGAFAVSSGTQCAVKTYAEADDEDKDPANMEQRYQNMRDSRFGILAPLMWLLACDGLLDVGQGDNPFNAYPDKTKKKIWNKLLKSLFYSVD